MLMCVQASNSLIIWSNGSWVAIKARTILSGVIPGTRMSAARPTRCWDVSLEPTASLTALDRKAELTMMGLPPSATLTNSKNSANRCRFARSASFGVLSRLRWSVWVSSASVKCGVTLMLRPGSSQTSSDRLGPAYPSSVAKDCHQGRGRPAQA